LQVSTTTFVLVALVIEVVCIAEERSRTGDSHVSIHVQVNTENHSVLGFFVTRRVNVFLHGDVEVVRAVPLVERCFGFLPFVSPVVLKRRPFLIDWRDVLSRHSFASGGEGYVVVVVRDGATVVNDDRASELRFTGFFAVFDDAVFAVADRRRRKVPCGLDETGL
jgi:hypothetical protein